MGKRSFSVAVGLVAIAGLGIASATGGAQTTTLADPPDVVRFTDARPTARVIDNSPRNSRLAAGDQTVFSARLLDKNQDVVGSHRGVCTVLTAAPYRAQCVETLLLPRGDIYLQGVVGTAAQRYIGIVGGTGSFEKARGSVRTTDREAGGVDLEIHIVE